LARIDSVGLGPHTAADLDAAAADADGSSSSRRRPLDPAIVRAQFPALARADTMPDPEQRWMYLDGAGGTQVHEAVIEAMGRTLAYRLRHISAAAGILDWLRFTYGFDSRSA
jgi:hypothetical protein